jgi:hypothetical protein
MRREAVEQAVEARKKYRTMAHERLDSEIAKMPQQMLAVMAYNAGKYEEAEQMFEDENYHDVAEAIMKMRRGF